VLRSALRLSRFHIRGQKKRSVFQQQKHLNFSDARCVRTIGSSFRARLRATDSRDSVPEPIALDGKDGKDGGRANNTLRRWFHKHRGMPSETLIRNRKNSSLRCLFGRCCVATARKKFARAGTVRRAWGSCTGVGHAGPPESTKEYKAPGIYKSCCSEAVMGVATTLSSAQRKQGTGKGREQQRSRLWARGGVAPSRRARQRRRRRTNQRPKRIVCAAPRRGAPHWRTPRTSRARESSVRARALLAPPGHRGPVPQRPEWSQDSGYRV